MISPRLEQTLPGSLERGYEEGYDPELTIVATLEPSGVIRKEFLAHVLSELIEDLEDTPVIYRSEKTPGSIYTWPNGCVRSGKPLGAHEERQARLLANYAKVSPALIEVLEPLVSCQVASAQPDQKKQRVVYAPVEVVKPEFL